MRQGVKGSVNSIVPYKGKVGLSVIWLLITRWGPRPRQSGPRDSEEGLVGWHPALHIRKTPRAAGGLLGWPGLPRLGTELCQTSRFPGHPCRSVHRGVNWLKKGR